MSTDQLARFHPISMLAVASNARLDDPLLEQERVVLIGAAIAAGRDAHRALDAWLSQSLVEYRGSHSAWDLRSTAAHLCQALDRYETTARRMATRLSAIIPDLTDSAPGSVVGVPARPSRQRVLYEVAAASRMLLATQAAVESGSLGPRER